MNWKTLSTQETRRAQVVRNSVHVLAIEILEDRVLWSATRVFSPIGIAPNFHPLASSAPSGLTPTQIRTAYGLTTTLFGSIAGDGTGQTIAIVDAYNAPTIKTDLAAFNAKFGLQAPPSFTVVNQTGGTSMPSNDTRGGWALETAMDVEWAHVIAPNANILLVLANSANDADLYKAVDTARNWAGVSAVSMSWGADEVSSDLSSDFHFTTPSGHTGVTFLASSGDAGAYSDSSSTTKVVGYPAASNNVVAVGGTYLTTTSGGAWSSETGWGSGTSSYNDGGSGGGISKWHTQPTYQKGVVTQSTTYRTLPDISMDADPSSGVPVYSAYDNGASTPWVTLGGTSLAAPLWAGVIAVANQGRVIAGLSNLDGATQTLPKLYSAPAADFHDITSGNNGYAAGAGYDLVTGIGTPKVNLLVKDLIGVTTPTPAIGSFAVNPTSIIVGATTAKLTASNVTEVGGTGTIANVKFYRESNSTSGLQTSGTADTLVGTGTASGTTYSLSFNPSTLAIGSYTYYAIATDTAGKTATSSVTFTVNDHAIPTIGTLAITPSSIVVGAASVSLAASSVAVTDGTITSVKFYRETNGTTGLQTTGTTDALIGTGVLSGTTYSLTSSTSALAIGSYTYYAIATASTGKVSAAKSATLTITDKPTPVIGSFAITPGTILPGAKISLSATGVTETGGTVASVKFYRETNNTTGLQTTGTTDTLLGTGVASGTTYTLANVATTGLAIGTYTYYAIATDTAGKSSLVKSATLVVTNSTAVAGNQLAWNMFGQISFGTQALAATTVGSNVTNAQKLSRGSGVDTTGAAANNAWGGKNWASTSAAGISGGQYITFGLTVKTGTALSLTSIDLNYRRSGAGPQSGMWQYQLGTGAWTTIGSYGGLFSSTATTGTAMTQVKLNTITSLQGIKAGTAVNFRLIPYAALSAGGTFYIYDGTANHNDLIVAGSSAVVAAFAPKARSVTTTVTDTSALLHPDPAILLAIPKTDKTIFSSLAKLIEL